MDDFYVFRLLGNSGTEIEGGCGVGAAATVLSALVQQAFNMAQQLFK